MSPYSTNREILKGLMLESAPGSGYSFHGYIWLGDRQYKFQAIPDTSRPGPRRWELRLTLHTSGSPPERSA